VKIVLLGQGYFLAPELEGYALPPAWRKATRNMIMATVSMERALKSLPGWIEKAHEQTALVLGSNSGELETSSEFLMTLDRTKMARPLLFQNSLHNATTGFASIHFKLTGPTFSLSSGQRMPGECLEMARALLLDGLCGACLVTLVEGHRLLAGFIDRQVEEGAVSLLLATESFALQAGYAVAGREEFDFAAWGAPYPDDPSCAPLTSITGSQLFKRVYELAK